MNQKPKNFDIFKYLKDIFVVFKKITLNIFDYLILFDLKFIIGNIKDIFITNKKYFLLFIFILPFVTIIVILMLIIGVINYIYFLFLYLKCIYTVYYKKKSKKIIKYKNDKINFVNSYNILLKKYILEMIICLIKIQLVITIIMHEMCIT